MVRHAHAASQVLFIGEDGGSHTETVFGGGFGAFAKMVDRAIVALTGWDALATRVQFDSAGHVVTFTNRASGESHRFTTVEQ